MAEGVGGISDGKGNLGKLMMGKRVMKPNNNDKTIRLAGFKTILALLLFLFLVSCGGEESATPSGSSDTGSPEAAQSADDTSTSEAAQSTDDVPIPNPSVPTAQESGQLSGNTTAQEPPPSDEAVNQSIPAAQENELSVATEPTQEAPQATESTTVTTPEPDKVGTDGNPPATAGTDSEQPETEQDDTIYLQIGERTYTATLTDNSSAQALKELLAADSVTIDMRDYGNMEKVGGFGKSLPTNDEQITTEPGDLILYQGNAFVIYYAANSWNFTRLGKINDISQEELKEALGDGNVTVTLSLKG
jgi:hypothetical protein